MALHMILPFLELGTVGTMFNYDYCTLDSVNHSADRQQLAVYQCPSDDAAGRAWHHTTQDIYFSRSNYAMCWGSDTLVRNSRGTYRDVAQSNPAGQPN